MLTLQNGIPLQVPDLAEALDGNYGTFYAECGGQGFVVTSSKGHSIVSLRPVGRQIVEQPSSNIAPKIWFVEKLSDETIFGNQATRK